MTEVREWVSEYTITAVPKSHRWADDSSFQITVEFRDRRPDGTILWGVCRHRECLNASGGWDWESIPSERSDEWLATHRFDLETALRLAREAAPDVSVNGMKARDLR